MSHGPFGAGGWRIHSVSALGVDAQGAVASSCEQEMELEAVRKPLLGPSGKGGTLGGSCLLDQPALHFHRSSRSPSGK